MEITLLVIITALTLVAFVLEWRPIDVVALTCLGALLLTGLITPHEAISGFSNPAVITVMMMFVLSHGLTHSGLVKRFGQFIARKAGGSRLLAVAALLLVGGSISAVINNTAAVAILLPVALQLARQYKTSPSRLLLPLSYMCIIGGTCTLIGTSTNLLVGAIAVEAGMEPIGIFEFLPVGAVLMILGLLHTLVLGPRLLPERIKESSLTSRYRLSEFLTEVRVPAGSKLIGRTVLQEQLNEKFQLNVLEILRGDQKIAFDLRSTPLREDDLLIVRGDMERIIEFKEQYRLLLLTDVKLEDSDLADDNNILAELQLSPESRLVGRTIKEIDFRPRYNSFVLALNRTGSMIRDKLASIRLREWDILLVFGPRNRVEALYELDDFLPIVEHDFKLRLHSRWWVSVVLIPVVLVLATTGVMDILKAAILGVVVMLLLGVISARRMYDSINWSVIFLLAAILPLGVAIKKTGLADLLGQALAHLGDGRGPLVVLAITYIATMFLTEMISNNAAAVMMAPIALSAAATIGANPRPFLFVVAFAASASFSTPMGYQTNAMVYGPGGYRFTDYLRFGIPLQAACCVTTLFLVPRLWPL